MADLRTMAAQLEQVADEMESLRRQLRELGRELDHERFVARQLTVDRNHLRDELGRVAHMLLSYGVSPDEIEADGYDAVMVRLLEHAQRMPAR